MNDRAVSVTVGHAMNLAVITILLSGVIIASGGMVESERERTANEELDVIGQQIADELMAADRMVIAGTDPTVEIRVDLPRQVVGSSYSVRLPGTDGDEQVIELETARPSVAISVPVETTTPVASTTVSGGRLTIEGNSDRLEVDRR